MNPGIRNQNRFTTTEDIEIGTRDANNEVMGQRNRPEPEPMFMEPEMYFDVRENNVPVVNLEVYSPTASRDARPGTPVYNPDVESPSASPIARPATPPQRREAPLPFRLDEGGRRSVPRITNEANWNTPRRRPRVIQTPGAPSRRRRMSGRRRRRVRWQNRVAMHLCPYDGAYFLSRTLLMDHVRRVHRLNTCPHHIIYVEFL